MIFFDVPPELYWLFPPVLTLRRRIITHAVMLAITLAAAWFSGWIYPA